MSTITKELLRKRAEHNEMMLTNLEEISLHQEELIKIENLDVFCRHLKILLLQNNIIEKMENLNKLKELEYCNLALNNITVIEGIDQCESLMKLDLTLNFVSAKTLQQSIDCLQKCRLKELYLTGNPCTDWAGYREFVIAQVDSLHSLDGKEIPHTERIKAKQHLEQLQKDLEYHIVEVEIKEEQKQSQKQFEQDEGKSSYTPEVRREMYYKMAKDKEDKDRQQNPDKYKVKEPTAMFLKDGRIRQCDEGGYKPKINQWDDPEYVVFQMFVPKYLDTSLIEVNINPTYISVRIKGKLTQLRLDEEIFVDKSTIQRSEITGELLIKMLKVNPNLYLKDIMDKKQKEEYNYLIIIRKEAILLKQEQEKQKQRTEKEKIELLIQKTQAKQTLLIDEDIPDLE